MIDRAKLVTHINNRIVQLVDMLSTGSWDEAAQAESQIDELRRLLGDVERGAFDAPALVGPPMLGRLPSDPTPAGYWIGEGE